MKMLGLLRIRNVAPWIEACIKSMWFCEHFIVLDGNSVDGTQEICAKFPNLELVSEPSQQGFNEGHDREVLAAMAQRYNPEWICAPDGDEIFLPDTWEHIKSFVDDRLVHVIEQHNLNLWDSETTVRWDGSWGQQYRQRFWRFQSGLLTYEINNNCLPNELPGRPEKPYAKAGKLIHYGNLNSSLRTGRFLRNERENMPFPALLDTDVKLISLDEALRSPLP